MILERRHFEFKDVIIRPDNIRTMVTAIDDTIKHLKETLDNPRLVTRFSIEAADKTKYQSSLTDIFDKDGILDKKQILGVSASINEFNSDFSITLEINASDYSPSKIMVSGDNPVLVNGTIKALENTISDCEKQFRFFSTYYTPLAFLLGAMVIYLVLFLTAKFQQSTGIILNITNNDSKLSVVGFYTVIIGFAYLPGSELVRYLERLWPSVELRTGSDYNQKLVKRRIIVGTIFTILIIPILFELVF